MISNFVKAIRDGGGLMPSITKAMRVYRQEGLSGVKARIGWIASTSTSLSADNASPEDNHDGMTIYNARNVSASSLLVAAQIDLGDTTRPSVGFDSDIGIFVHLFYADLADEIAKMLVVLPVRFTIYVSTDSQEKKQAIRSVFEEHQLLGRLVIKVMPNRGWDIAPFVVGFADEIRQHEICLKIHGKKSTHNSPEFGEKWRSYLYSELIGDADRIAYIVDTFATNPELGILIPQYWKGVKGWLGIGNNYQVMQSLLADLDISLRPFDQIDFPSSSMFWFRSKAISSLLAMDLCWEDFSDTHSDARDATLAHGIERCFLVFAAKSGYCWAFIPQRERIGRMTPEECISLLRKSGDFDAGYYLLQNPDVAKLGVDPVHHYCHYGWQEGRNPSASFDSRYYSKLIRNQSGESINPLVHYVLEGSARGLLTRRQKVFPAHIVVDDLYTAYKRADSGADYEAESFPLLRKTTIKPIAFYFPQFHPFEENNQFWGAGFTEWTNTTKALPMFRGHYQPRLPGELGFYDTRLKEILERQIELAKQYGIHGFCFHHYFFEGKPVMRAPYNHIIGNKDLDIPFCLHWANEPWTVRWDGLANKTGMLLDQRHSPEDDLAFFEDIAPALTDSRYITVEGRPLIIIYRPGLFPDMKKTIARWRECCRKLGLKDLYLAVMQTGFEGMVDPRKYGFDAAIEYPPHNLGVKNCAHRVQLYDPGFEGNVFDYNEASGKALARPKPSYTMFRGIIPEWDCTPRRADPDLFINCKPVAYQQWFEGLCRYTEKNLPVNQRFIFINAWNEWAEGAYMEPDRKYGYGYLGATSRALNRHAAEQPAPKIKVAVGAHIFYTDLLEEFLGHFEKLPGVFDLFITTSDRNTDAIRTAILGRLGKKVGKLTLVTVENVGRDMGPFILHFLPNSQTYDACCWVHSKKSPYEPAYAPWRSYLLENLLGTPENIAAILETFSADDHLGVIYAKTFPEVADKIEWGSNFPTVAMLASRLGLPLLESDRPEFPTGGMFWFRPKALKSLLSLGLALEDFVRLRHGPSDPATQSVVDGTLSHALERMILYVSRHAGYSDREFLFKPYVKL